MKKPNTAMIFAFMCVAASAARAAQPSAAQATQNSNNGCRRLAELNEAVQDCDGNRKYLEAGQACVQTFRAFMAAEKESALRSLEAVQAGGLVAGPKHSEAVQTLGKVLDAGEAAGESLKGYLANIVYPEDWDAPPEVIGNPADFFNSHKCYRESRDGLESLTEEIDLSVKQVVEALAARPPTAAKPVH